MGFYVCEHFVLPVITHIEVCAHFRTISALVSEILTGVGVTHDHLVNGCIRCNRTIIAELCAFAILMVVDIMYAEVVLSFLWK